MPNSSVLTKGGIIGLVLISEAGMLSMLAVTVMFVLVFRNVRRKRRMNPAEWHVVKDPMDLYLIVLFGADFVQALGAVMDIRWAHTGIVVTGTYCRAQGSIQQLGETSVAMITLMIALHTLISAWWPKRTPNLFVAKILVTLVLLYVIFFVAIGVGLFAHKGYEAPTYWCWIGDKYRYQQLFGEYFWFWVTLIVSFVAYIPLYFSIRGNLSVDPDVWWKFHVHRKRQGQASGPSAISLLAYPLIYSISVLPLTFARWLEFKREWAGVPNNIPGAATFTVAAIYSLSGFANVVLFTSTRPDLLIFQRNPAATMDEGQLPIQDINVSSESPEQNTANIGALPPVGGGDWDLPADVEEHELENV